MIPWYIGTIVKYIFAMTDAGGGATVSAAYSFVLYLLAVVQAFGVYMSMISHCWDWLINTVMLRKDRLCDGGE